MAGVAQLVEQLIRNQQVRGSSPRAGSKNVEGNRIVTPMPLFCFLLKNPANFGKFRPACRQNAYKKYPNSDYLPGTLVERFEMHRYQSANQTFPISTECSYPKYKIDSIPFSNFYLKASAVTGVMSRPYFFALSIPPAPHKKQAAKDRLASQNKRGSFLEGLKVRFPSAHPSRPVKITKMDGKWNFCILHISVNLLLLNVI